MTSELPEHRIFSILRNGEEEPRGPYSQNQLIELLNEGAVKPIDWVHYPDLTTWAKISDVFDVEEAVSGFEDHGQDKDLFGQVFNGLNDAIEDDEEIYYIATQHLPAMGLTAAIRLTTPKSVALTNLCIYIIEHKMRGGIEVEQFPLGEVVAASGKLKTGDKEGSFSILLKTAERVEVDRIPVEQLDHLKAHYDARVEELEAA